MPVWTTLLVGKSIARLSRLSGRGGGQALPGLVAEQLDPKLLRKISQKFPQGIVLVTGTNGKTTTAKLLASMLEKKGWRVLTNSTGSNLKRGIVSAVIDGASISGNLPFDAAVFEVDEATLRLVAGLLQPKYIVVLNLFRDQLDRYGELDTTAALIGEGIGQTESTLCLNADDPLVASLVKYAAKPEQTMYFGVGQSVDHRPSLITATDSDRCPICHELLQFPRVWFGHIGHYKCHNCGYKRPKPGVEITSISEMTTQSSRLEMRLMGAKLTVNFQLPGIYNVYNAAAASAVATLWGIDTLMVSRALSDSVPAFGRVERVTYKGRTICILLIKNPAGFAQVVQTFLQDRSGLAVLFAINDLHADGRDVSWLWDVPLEGLSRQHLDLWVTGLRSWDMALRLKYAGMESIVESDIRGALDNLVSSRPEGSEVYVLPTYTAMNDIRSVLGKVTEVEKIQ